MQPIVVLVLTVLATSLHLPAIRSVSQEEKKDLSVKVLVHPGWMWGVQERKVVERQCSVKLLQLLLLIHRQKAGTGVSGRFPEDCSGNISLRCCRVPVTTAVRYFG